MILRFFVNTGDVIKNVNPVTSWTAFVTINVQKELWQTISAFTIMPEAL